MTIDHKIELHAAKKSTLQDLFKTILNKLMTGEVRVKDLDIDVSGGGIMIVTLFPNDFDE